ncbi:MAG TPA: oligoribonuclease [Candidatus Babeliales bacterium]|jgi:oligoribonuclease|nr:oligoribonuclease [Candidatus Babeliales bacterium]
MINEHNVLWLDLEMTGTNPEKDHIIQIAAIVTDQNLQFKAEGPEIVIHQPKEHMQTMSPEVCALHTNSGLLNRVYESKISVEFAEREIIAFAKRYCIAGATILCGNSIWVDRTFIKRYMPFFDQLLHYRMIDVSTIKELVARWYPDKPKFEKKKQHTALSDIYESIEELRYYRKTYFVNL